MSALTNTSHEIKEGQKNSKQFHEEQQKLIISLRSEVAELKAQNLKELVMSGHLNSETEGCNLKDLVIEIANFFGV